MTIDMNRLPIPLGDVVSFVINTHMRPLLDVPVPPHPALHVLLGVRECMQPFDGLEVADGQGFVLRRARRGVQPGSRAQEAEVLAVRVEVLNHGLEVVADVFHAGRQYAERVVVAEADEEDDDFGIGGLRAVGAVRVGEGCGEFVHDHAGHEGVGFPS